MNSKLCKELSIPPEQIYKSTKDIFSPCKKMSFSKFSQNIFLNIEIKQNLNSLKNKLVFKIKGKICFIVFSIPLEKRNIRIQN